MLCGAGKAGLERHQPSTAALAAGEVWRPLQVLMWPAAAAEPAAEAMRSSDLCQTGNLHSPRPPRCGLWRPVPLRHDRLRLQPLRRRSHRPLVRRMKTGG